MAMAFHAGGDVGDEPPPRTLAYVLARGILGGGLRRLFKDGGNGVIALAGALFEQVFGAAIGYVGFCSALQGVRAADLLGERGEWVCVLLLRVLRIGEARIRRRRRRWRSRGSVAGLPVAGQLFVIVSRMMSGKRSQRGIVNGLTWWRRIGCKFLRCLCCRRRLGSINWALVIRWIRGGRRGRRGGAVGMGGSR